MSEPTRERCDLCGGVKMGPLFWADEAPKDEQICRRGRVAFSGPEWDGYYDCLGNRTPSVVITSAKAEER